MTDFTCTHNGITVAIVDSIMLNDGSIPHVEVMVNGKRTWYDYKFGAANKNLTRLENDAAESALSEFERSFCLEV